MLNSLRKRHLGLRKCLRSEFVLASVLLSYSAKKNRVLLSRHIAASLNQPRLNKLELRTNRPRPMRPRLNRPRPMLNKPRLYAEHSAIEEHTAVAAEPPA